MNFPQDTGDLLCGMLDVLIGIGVVLANSELVERAAIAQAMTGVIAQQLDQDPNASAARRYPAKIMRAFFERPVVGSDEAEAQRRRNALRVIGNDSDPPAA